MNFICFIDVLGTKNSSENENFEDYLSSVTNFQNYLLSDSYILETVGRIHFFSDCAYIESTNLEALLQYLIRLRQDLMDIGIFVRGAITEGILGAVCGEESDEIFQKNYNNETIQKRYNSLKGILEKTKHIAKGTIVLSKDLSKAYSLENFIKGASIGVQETIALLASSYVVKSGFIKSVDKCQYQWFFDLKYEESYISKEFLDHLLHHYTLSNLSDISYGRYYLSILITCINSVNFEGLKYDDLSSKFVSFPPLFDYIINLRTKYRSLYNYAIGLEFLYFKLIDKIYEDFNEANEMTKTILYNILQNKRYISKYQNKLSSIPKEIISGKSRTLLLKDYNTLVLSNKI